MMQLIAATLVSLGPCVIALPITTIAREGKKKMEEKEKEKKGKKKKKMQDNIRNQVMVKVLANNTESKCTYAKYID